LFVDVGVVVLFVVVVAVIVLLDVDELCPILPLLLPALIGFVVFLFFGDPVELVINEINKSKKEKRKVR
jgi:hypothetical protein